jgi:hypothetical protein
MGHTILPVILEFPAYPFFLKKTIGLVSKSRQNATNPAIRLHKIDFQQATIFSIHDPEGDGYGTGMMTNVIYFCISTGLHYLCRSINQK